MMRVIIVGMGIQGRKRKKFLGKEFKYSVDKYKTADFHSIYEVPLKKYDAVLVCVPDNEKFNIINYCMASLLQLRFSTCLEDNYSNYLL